MNKKLGMLGAMTGTCIFGFSFMFSRIALSVASPYVMLMYRFVLAFATLNILLGVLRMAGADHSKDEQVHWLRFSLRGKNLLPLVVLGLVQPVLYFLCESYGISLTNSTFSGVIIALSPIVGLALGALFLREYPTRAQVWFSLLSIAGVIAITLRQTSEGVVQPLGVVLLVMAVLSGTSYNLLSRKASHFSALEQTWVMMLIAALCFTGLAVWDCRSDLSLLFAPLGSLPFMASVLYLSVFSSNIAFMSLNYANSVLPVARVTSFCNLTTVISVFAGVIFLHEPFGWVSLMASVVIIIGVWGVQRKAR